MSRTYRFLPEETVAEAAGRVAREQLDGAIDELTTGRQEDPVEAVHDSRKAIKRERSLLRLLRRSLPADERRRQNAVLRDAAHRLAGARDAAALVGAVDDLSERYAGQLPERAFTAIRDALAAEHDGHHGPDDLAARADAAASDLDAVREWTATWELDDPGRRTVEAGIGRAYSRGRKAMARARRRQSTDALHDWRKRVKDLWYHSQLLRAIGGPVVKGQAKDAHRLANLLGDDHDLAVLDAALARGLSAPVDVDGVRELIAHRRDELQAEAFALGRRVYAETPKAFRRRMRQFWRAARATSAGGTPAAA